MNKEIVKRFISNYEIGSVVVGISIVDNKCCISLRGGYSISIEVINDMLYKDGKLYCTLDYLNK